MHIMNRYICNDQVSDQISCKEKFNMIHCTRHGTIIAFLRSVVQIIMLFINIKTKTLLPSPIVVVISEVGIGKKENAKFHRTDDRCNFTTCIKCCRS